MTSIKTFKQEKQRSYLYKNENVETLMNNTKQRQPINIGLLTKARCKLMQRV